MDRIRIGVIGPGLIWQNSHQPALALLQDRVEITAFAASSERRRAAVERDYPRAPFYLDYRALLASPEVDWVLVLTPIALNAPVALAALRAGKNVLLEKPMGRSLAEGEALVRTADECGRRLYVLEQAVYPPYLDMVEQVLCAGEIGQVVMYDQVAHELFDATPAHSAGGYGATEWRIHPDFPLGPLFDGGHHPIARLSRLFGRPASLYASGHQIRPTYGSFDHVLVLMEYDSGVRGSFSHATMLSERKNYLHIRGAEGTLTVETDRLLIERNDGAHREIALPPEQPFVAMWRALLGAIAGGAEPYYTKERALQDLSILLAIERSANAGARGAV